MAQVVGRSRGRGRERPRAPRRGKVGLLGALVRPGPEGLVKEAGQGWREGECASVSIAPKIPYEASREGSERGAFQVGEGSCP